MRYLLCALGTYLHNEYHNVVAYYFFLLFCIFMLSLYSLLGAIFPLPRILYAMASDGLLFKFLSNINTTTKTPLISTVICGVFAGNTLVTNAHCRRLGPDNNCIFILPIIPLYSLLTGTLATVFNLEQLIDMASIGTLQAYTIVCICVLILRLVGRLRVVF